MWGADEFTPFTIEYERAPRKRHTRIWITLMLVAAFFVGMCTSSYGVPGQTANGGITVHFGGSMYYGVEIWGHPGFFSENCSDGC